MEMTIAFPGGKRVDAQFNGFTVKTDQPVQGGGDGSAPSPFDIFLSSIGTCAGIYVLGFCQQRGIPTDGLEIKQTLKFNPATRLVDQINLVIHLPENFPEKYKSAVISSANLCAVKRHLENPPKFNVTTQPG